MAGCARRRQLRQFVDDLVAGGAKPATAVSRHLAVRRYSAWLAEEGEQPDDPLLGLRAPKLDRPVIEPLIDDQLRAMVKACRGAELRDKRDEAILRLMFTTGARAGEMVALQTGDLSLRTDPATATIRRGKGFTYDALHKTLAMRAQRAGVEASTPTCFATPRCPLLARQGRLRGWLDGGRRLDAARHAAPVHQGPGLVSRRRGGAAAQPRRAVDAPWLPPAIEAAGHSLVVPVLIRIYAPRI